MQAFITLDVGGTNIRGAVFTGNEIKPQTLKKIPTYQNGLSAIENIKLLIKEIWPKDCHVQGISTTAPGSIDINEGIVILAPNISGWENIHLREILAEEFSCKVYVNNDARLAALGEWKYGAGVGHKDLLYFTISTGIGGGAIVNSKLVEGCLGIATELGHITLVDDGPLCGCGHYGHLEAFSSGTGIELFIEKAVRDGVKTSLKGSPSSKTIAKAALQGDKLAISAFNRAAYYLGRGVANYLHIFNPSCIIFGGGVSQAGELLFKPFKQSLQKHVLSDRYTSNLEIKMAALGDDAGLIGALEYMKERL